MRKLNEVIEGIMDRIGFGDPLLSDALHYLKEYQEKTDEICKLAKIMADSWELRKQTMAFEDRNDPLKYDELKEMIGKPVWIEEYDPIDDSHGWRMNYWSLAYGIFTDPHNFMCHDVNAQAHILRKSEYRKTWCAFRKEHHD